MSQHENRIGKMIRIDILCRKKSILYFKTIRILYMFYKILMIFLYVLLYVEFEMGGF